MPDRGAPPLRPARPLAGRLALRLLVLCLLVAPLALGLLGAVPVSPALAASPAAAEPLQVRVRDIEPTTLRPGVPVVVTGTLVNRSATPVADVRVQLAVLSRIASRAELAAQRETPAPVQRVVTPPVRVDAQRALPAGASVPWQLSLADAAALGLPADGQVMALQVQAVGGVAGAEAVQGRATVTVPVFPAPIRSPVEVALVVPVTAPPDWLPVADGTAPAASDDLLAALAPEGRLGRLLALGEVAQDQGVAARITFAIDPALVRRVVALAPPDADAQAGAGPGAGSPTPPTPPTGTSASGGPSRATVVARAWLQRLQRVAQAPGVTVLALPEADADVAALAASPAGPSRDTVRLLQRAPADLADLLGRSAADPGLIVAPPDGVLPAPADALSQSAGATLGVVSDAQLPAAASMAGTSADGRVHPATTTAVSRLPAGAGPGADAGGGLPVLVTDRQLQSLLDRASTAGPDEARVSELDLLCELALITAEAPNLDTRRAAVLLTPRDWSPALVGVRRLLVDLASAAFVQAASAQSLLRVAAPPPGDPVRTPTDLDLPTMLPQPVLADVAALRERVAALADLPPAGMVERRSPPLLDALDRATSVAWRSDPTGGQALRDRVRVIAEGDLAKVGAFTNPGGVRLTGVTGSVPVQLSNGLDGPVAVHLQLREADGGDAVQSAGRQLVLDRTPRGAPPLVRQETVTVKVRTTGTTQVHLQLLTKGGLAVLAEPRSLAVTSSAIGPVAVGITAGALTVLALAFVLRGVRWARRRRSRA